MMSRKIRIALAVTLLALAALSAVDSAMSDAPEGLRAKRRDLESHKVILDLLYEAGPVLPDP
jgi:hypothetical protein